MGDLLLVLLALVPAAANTLGGLLAEAVSLSARVFSAALHLAGGIVIAVVGRGDGPRGLRGQASRLDSFYLTLGFVVFAAATTYLG